MLNQILDQAPICPQFVNDLMRKEITPEDGTAIITLHVAGANGSCIKSLECFSSDKIDHDIRLYLTIDSIDYELATVPLYHGGETNLLRGLKIKNAMQLAPGVTLRAALREAVKTSRLEIYGWIYNY